MDRYVSEKLKLKGSVFSLDVECVAVGKTHLTKDTVPAKFALVNSQGKTLCVQYIRPEKRVVSYLTPLSGVRAEDLEGAVSLEEAIEMLKSHLPKDAILVGQKVDSDITWMQLKQGEDFADFVDLSEVFKGYNVKYKEAQYHSLLHEARILLNLPDLDTAGEHDPAIDARLSVQLWEKVKSRPDQLGEMRQRLIHSRTKMSVKKRLNYQYEGVCLASFYPEKCICGMPTSKQRD